MIDFDWSFNWLSSSTLKVESEGFLLALQDQAVATRSHRVVSWNAKYHEFVGNAHFSRKQFPQLCLGVQISPPISICVDTITD